MYLWFTNGDTTHRVVKSRTRACGAELQYARNNIASGGQIYGLVDNC